MNHVDSLPKEWVEVIMPRIFGALKLYHRHSTVNIHNIPRSGPVIVCTNHSLATYDAFLFGLDMYQRANRYPVGLGDDLLFRIPGLRKIAADIGLFPASPKQGLELLKQGQLLSVAPGGMKEGLRSTRQKYQTCWERRKGFVRLAVRAQVPIVLSACPKADDIYTNYPNPITPWIYKKLKCPLPIARGLGLSLIPRPVKLTHLVSEPLQPPEFGPENEEQFAELVDSFHAKVIRTMDQLMRDALKI